MEKQLKEFADRLSSAAPANLLSVILYGSFDSEDFHHGFSDINLMCVFGELSEQAIRMVSPAVLWWAEKKHAAPMLFTRRELERGADVFPIEFLDIQQRHRVLLGDDLIAGLEIPMTLHRVQLEHELRTKLVLLRQRYIVASGNRDKVLELLLDSLSSFLTLFRHTLIALGDPPPRKKRATIEHVGQKLDIDGSAFLELLAVREGSVKQSAVEVDGLVSRYLRCIERVIEAVDAL